MRLAAHLHRTEAEAKETVSLDEFWRWQAVDELEPWGRKAETIQLAVVAASLCRAQGAKIEAKDFLTPDPDWWPRIETDQDAVTEQFRKDFG